MSQALSSQSHPKHQTSCGKIPLLTKMPHTKTVKKVVSLKCLDGLTPTLKPSAKLLVKWAGWELKFSPLKNQYFHTNGHKMGN
jgi:hypothetical protein